MFIAANIATPARGERSRLAESQGRGRARLTAWREQNSATAPRFAHFDDDIKDRARLRRAEERWQSLDVCALDDAGQVALEQRRWMQATGASPFDLYVMIEGREPPTHLTPDDLFALIVCAYLTVRHAASRL